MRCMDYLTVTLELFPFHVGRLHDYQFPAAISNLEPKLSAKQWHQQGCSLIVLQYPTVECKVNETDKNALDYAAIFRLVFPFK